MDAAGKDNEKPKFTDVAAVVAISTKLGSTCLPGVLSAEDFIAIAYTESKFDTLAVGKAGERGIWQVLEWKELKKPLKIKNPFDVASNGAMVCHVLRQKYCRFKGYRKLITAYNGFKKHSTYFSRVQQFKSRLYANR